MRPTADALALLVEQSGLVASVEQTTSFYRLVLVPLSFAQSVCHMPDRQTTTTFLIRQHVSPAPSLQPTLAGPDQDDLAAMIASALADSAADVLQPPAKRMRHSGLSSQVPRASQHGQPMKGGFCLLHVQGLQDTANR